jgi:two-component system sensor histidine kinase/response regulator
MTLVRRKKVFDNLQEQKILVVDDNLTNRLLLEQLLTQWQVEHTLVDSGKKALEKLTEESAKGTPYHIAILDMQMPQMDGFQLGTKIKNDNLLFKNTRLVMLTSQGQRGDADKLKAAGFNGYLNKPIDQTILYNTLMTVAGIDCLEQPLVTAHSSRELPQFTARVLVVEDNAVNQKVAQGLLKKFGVQVDLAANGEEALNSLENLPFDLVLMDCQMPVMDGYEATQKIRHSGSKVLNRDIPIIAMTANSMEGDREKCLAVGMDDFISKPVNPNKVQEVLKRWLPK